VREGLAQSRPERARIVTKYFVESPIRRKVTAVLESEGAEVGVGKSRTNISLV
jgi:hypothetical protein